VEIKSLTHIFQCPLKELRDSIIVHCDALRSVSPLLELQPRALLLIDLWLLLTALSVVILVITLPTRATRASSLLLSIVVVAVLVRVATRSNHRRSFFFNHHHLLDLDVYLTHFLYLFHRKENAIFLKVAALFDSGLRHAVGGMSKSE
jgi:hypothetical protein